MATAKHFEDLQVWQDSQAMVLEIYTATKQDGFRRDFSLRDQIIRAATSTMSNIAEGFERGTRKEFTQFLNIAKGSSGEVRSQLYVALDQKYINEQTFEQLRRSSLALSRRISKFISYLESLPGNRRHRARVQLPSTAETPSCNLQLST